MRRSSIIVLAAGVLLLGGAWWLLRGDGTHAPVGPTASLRKPADARASGAPGFSAPVPVPAVPAPSPLVSPTPSPAEPDTARSAVRGTPEPLDLLVTHADGAPASGVSVAIGRDGVLLASAVTDGDGRVHLQLPAADAGVVGADVAIGGASDRPLRMHLDQASGSQTIVLPAGEVVEGRVLVDGAPPTRPLQLLLTSPENHAETNRLGALLIALYTNVPGVAQSSFFNAQLVGRDGRFRYSALSPDTWRTLDAEKNFTWPHDPASDAADGFGPAPASSEDEEDEGSDRDEYGPRPSRPVLAPATRLVVRLRSSPTLSGRVVSADGSAPVPLATIRGVLRWNRGKGVLIDAACDAAGRFALPMRGSPGPADAFSMTIKHPEGRGSRVLEFGAEDCARSHDVGDIRLDPTHHVLLTVQDVEGAPIAGAVAVSDDASALRSPPTDAAGRTELHLPATGASSITVWAHRYRFQVVPLPWGDAPATSPPPAEPAASEDTPLVVVLQRAPSLEVTVVRTDGTPPDALGLTLRAKQALFGSAGREGLGVGFLPHSILQSLGMTARSSGGTGPLPDGVSRAEAGGYISLRVPESGRVTATDMLAGVPFELIVHDRWGGIVHGPDELVLGPEEWRELQVVVSSIPRDLIIVVRDPHDAPLRGVATGENGTKGTFFEWDIGADGRLMLPGVEGPGFTLVVRSRGFVDHVLVDPAPSADGTPLRVVMQPGRAVHLAVRDARGREVPAEQVSARFGGWEVGRHRLDEPSAGVPLADLESSEERLVERPEEHAAGGASAGDRSRWLFEELPAETLQMQAIVGGTSFSTTCTATQSNVEIIVPETGGLRVRWELPAGDAWQQWLDVETGGADGATGVLALRKHLSGAEREQMETFLPALLPGSYLVRLFQMQPAAESSVAAGPGTVTVAAGTITSVLLTAP